MTGFLVAAAVSALAAQAPPPQPTTLLQAPRPIYAFAQEGPWLAWITPVTDELGAEGDRLTGVFARRGRGRPVRLTKPTQSPYDIVSTGDTYTIALSAERAVWSTRGVGHNIYTHLYTVPVRGGRVVEVSRLSYDAADGSGRSLGGMAGDANVLAYAAARHDFGDCDPDERGCNLVGGGTTYRVDAREHEIPNSVGGIAIAIAAPHVATVPHVASTSSWPIASPTETAIRIQNAFTGAVVAQFEPTATPVDVALTRRYAFILVQAAAGRRIEVRTADGALARTIGVSGSVEHIAAGGSTVAYANDRDIFALTEPAFAKRRVVRAAAMPWGLSIEGRRLAWGEDSGDGSRIRAVQL